MDTTTFRTFGCSRVAHARPMRRLTLFIKLRAPVVYIKRPTRPIRIIAFNEMVNCLHVHGTTNAKYFWSSGSDPTSTVHVGARGRWVTRSVERNTIV